MKETKNPVAEFMSIFKGNESCLSTDKNVIVLEDKVSFSLSVYPMDRFGVYVSDIFSFKRKSGAGTWLLNLLKEKALELQVNLYLIPKAYGRGGGRLTQKELENWYLKNGFHTFETEVLTFQGRGLRKEQNGEGGNEKL